MIVRNEQVLLFASTCFLFNCGEESSPLLKGALAIFMTVLYIGCSLNLSFSFKQSAPPDEKTAAVSAKAASDLDQYLNKGWIEDPESNTILYHDHDFITCKLYHISTYDP
jgi:hypothetical protein